jgi:signal transduction histidine kinase
MFANDRRERCTVSIDALVSEVVAAVASQLESHRIRLQRELREGLPQVSADRVQLQQVLLNLITNAIDAMSAVDDRERVLTIRSEPCENDHVLIAIEDSGTGFDPRHDERIFDAFFTTKPHGMGMGLSICRSIIEAHGGRLWAALRKPHGSVFYVKLPSLS